MSISELCLKDKHITAEKKSQIGTDTKKDTIYINAHLYVIFNISIYLSMFAYIILSIKYLINRTYMLN